MDPVQFVILLISIIVTAAILVIGYQVYQLLKDIRKSLHKMNRILDDTGDITESVKKPVSSLANLTSGIQAGIGIIEKFANRK